MAPDISHPTVPEISEYSRQFYDGSRKWSVDGFEDSNGIFQKWGNDSSNRPPTPNPPSSLSELSDSLEDVAKHHDPKRQDDAVPIPHQQLLASYIHMSEEAKLAAPPPSFSNLLVKAFTCSEVASFPINLRQPERGFLDGLKMVGVDFPDDIVKEATGRIGGQTIPPPKAIPSSWKNKQKQKGAVENTVEHRESTPNPPPQGALGEPAHQAPTDNNGLSELQNIERNPKECKARIQQLEAKKTRGSIIPFRSPTHLNAARGSFKKEGVCTSEGVEKGVGEPEKSPWSATSSLSDPPSNLGEFVKFLVLNILPHLFPSQSYTDAVLKNPKPTMPAAAKGVQKVSEVSPHSGRREAKSTPVSASVQRLSNPTVNAQGHVLERQNHDRGGINVGSKFESDLSRGGDNKKNISRSDHDDSKKRKKKDDSEDGEDYGAADGNSKGGNRGSSNPASNDPTQEQRSRKTSHEGQADTGKRTTAHDTQAAEFEGVEKDEVEPKMPAKGKKTPVKKKCNDRKVLRELGRSESGEGPESSPEKPAKGKKTPMNKKGVARKVSNQAEPSESEAEEELESRLEELANGKKAPVTKRIARKERKESKRVDSESDEESEHTPETLAKG
ncbi:uncharacterized protein BDR25DRAFT_343110 [Lindgomyces ingoldianus]|uniref:Uncharacterized protein n=1 Tax=Lindgomyces ingoldianus TaxID=673940 RepID=A0ACB6QTJ8_9PLEO|nr:uncharacterized protein BDR25DRAFT_343110 [Lindgomyces ingoldianus]KAF2470344.1 hypothetical protein BDR25DRAFT_343110 [Lindgomyces ingoldianus]